MGEKGNLFKLIFLLLISILLLSISIYSFINSGKSKEKEENWLEVKPIVEQEKQAVAVKEPKEKSETTEQKNEILNESASNFEMDYVKKYGADSVQEGKNISKKVVTMWLEQEIDKTKWETYTTSSFFNQIDKEVLSISDGIKRKVKQLNVYAVPLAKGEGGKMKFELDAKWEVEKGEKVLGEKTRIYYAILTSTNDGKWVVKELIQL